MEVESIISPQGIAVVVFLRLENNPLTNGAGTVGSLLTPTSVLINWIVRAVTHRQCAKVT